MKLLQLPLILCTLATLLVDAFPRLPNGGDGSSAKRSTQSANCPYSSTNKQVKRQITFEPSAQYVSTTGANAFVPPDFTAGDQRGPCPGLNALANHGYLPHSGVASLTAITAAVNTVYSMGLDLGGFLAVYGTVFDGNSLSSTPGYSIGGPTTSEAILGGLGLLGTPTGLSGSHNNYESDSSPTRGDLYVVGNDYLLQVPQFQQYYDALPDKMAAPKQYEALLPFRQARFNDSISSNPYFFYPQFAGVLVSPAGYAFPAAMMANHSAEYPDGYLDKQTFKSFFAISGDSGAFTYQPGHERIPDNWYKRPALDPYTIPGFVADVLKFGIQDPRLLSVGGNTGTNNSFTGVDIGALTKGVFNGATLTEGDNLECFIFQLIQAEAPGFLTSLYTDVTEALQPLAENIASNLANLSCPQLNGIDSSQYNAYPGYSKAKGIL